MNTTMESKSVLGFLDDTSLLNTPKSPQKTSTSRKDNKQIREPENSILNLTYNSIKNDVNDDLLSTEINLMLNMPAKKLDLNFSAASFNSSNNSNSSLGLITWGEINDFSSLELNEPVQTRPPFNKPQNNEDTQSALEGEIKATPNLLNANSERYSSALPPLDYSVSGTSLTREEKLFIVYGETSKEMKEMLAGLNDNMNDSRTSLTPHEQLFILYGEQSREMKEVLSGLETANNIKKSDPEFSKTFSLQNEEANCISPESNVSNVCNVDDSNSPNDFGDFPRSSGESSFQQASLEYHNLMTPPRFKPNINRWLSSIEASFTNEKTLTPSRVNPFSNKSSFVLDDLYTSNPELQTDSESPRTGPFNTKNLNEVAVEPISMKQPFLGSFVEGDSIAQSIEPDVSYIEEDMEIVSTDYENELFILNENNTNDSGLYSGDNQYIPDTSLAFCSDILSEFKINEQNLENFKFSGDEFVNAEEGLMKMPAYSENSFERENLPELNMCNSKVSQYSTWSIASQNQFVHRPSWWSEINDETKSNISVGRVFAARSENVGVLTTDKNRDRPFFGNDVASPPKLCDYGAMHDGANISLENDTGEGFTSVSSQTINESCANDSTQNSFIDASIISRIAAEISMTDRRSVVADKFLNTVFQKKTKKIHTKGQSKKINTILNYKDVKMPALLEKASSSLELSPQPLLENDSTVVNESESLQQLEQNILESEHVEKKFMNDPNRSTNKELNIETNKTHLIECHNNLSSVPLRSVAAQPDSTFKPIPSPLKPDDNLQHVTGQETGPCDKICAQALEPFLKPSEAPSKNSLTDAQPTFPSDAPSLQDTQSTALNNSIYSTTSSQESTSSTTRDSAHPCCVHTQSRPGSSCSTGCTASIQNRPCLATPCIPNFSDPHNPYLLTVIPNLGYFPSSMNSLPPMGVMSQPAPYLHKAHFGSMNNLAPNLPIELTFSTALQVQSVPLGLSGFVVGQCVIAPVEYNHPAICLGDIAHATIDLKNPTSTNLFYHLAFTSASLNNAPIPVTSLEACVQDHVFAVAGASITVPLKFVPSLEGKVRLTLEVSPSLSIVKDPPSLSVSLPCFITVNLEIEKPYLSLSSQGQDWLDFPAIIKESTITETVTLSYRCRASFPLWLDISEVDGDHSLRFSELELNSASDRANVLESILLTPRQMFCHLTGAESSSQYKCIKIPIIFKAGKCSKKQQETISFTLSAGIGRSTNKSSTSMKISATVGTVILSTHKATTKSIVLKVQENTKGVYALKIINTGTISATVDLAVNCERDDFLVMPPTIQLDPQKVLPVTLFFKPTSSEVIKGMLQAAMRPCGEIFDLIPVEGHVVTKWISAAKHLHRNFESESQHIVDSSIPVIETDKKFLAWGGVSIAANACKRMTIRNTSATKSFTASVFIKEKTDSFKIVDDKNRVVEILQLELRPFSVKYIKVMFSPPVISVFSGHLIIKPNAVSHGLFRIPLSGYCGVSEVYLLDVPKNQIGNSDLEIAFNNSIGMGFTEVKLRNIGARAAYVKIIEKNNSGCYDLKLRVKPSEFIVSKYQTTTVTVSYGRSSTDPYNINSRRYCGKLLFFYGDEILRQKLRRSQYKASTNLKFNAEVQGIDFNLPFMNEEVVPYEELYPDSPKDTYLFYSSLKILHLDVSLKSQDEISLIEYFSTLSLVPDISSDHTSQEDSTAQSI